MAKWFKSDARYVRRTNKGAGPDEAWTSYTPTVTATGGAIGAYTLHSAKYKRVGTIVHVVVDLTITDVGTAANTAIIVTLPFPTVGIHIGTMREIALNGSSGSFTMDGTTGVMSFYNNTGSIAANYRSCASGTYETSPP